MLAKLAIVLGAFAVGVGLAELFGAKNLGTSFGVGQLTFAVGARLRARAALASELDLGAERDRPLARQVEVVGRLGG